MVKNPQKLQAFEAARAMAEKVDFEQNLRILDALYEEAVELGELPRKDPLEGIEDKIYAAWKLNGIKGTREDIARTVAKYRRKS